MTHKNKSTKPHPTNTTRSIAPNKLQTVQGGVKHIEGWTIKQS